MPDKAENTTGDLFALAARLGKGKLPPVASWQPEFCGDIDLRIARDGTWYYMGTPIGRRRLVKLFSTVLRREGEKYFLVTPVEKLGITVDDAPFVAVEADARGHGRGQEIVFRTNVDELLTAGAEHPVRVAENSDTGEPAPYILVRDGLEALIARPVYYQLAALGETDSDSGEGAFGVWSGGRFFVLGHLDPES